MAITFLAVSIVILGVFYAVLMGAFVAGLHRTLSASAPPATTPRPFVSVVVPARNEENDIDDCLRAILASRYPRDRYEIVVVDDASEDRTAARVRRLQRELETGALAASKADAPGASADEPPRLRLVQLAELDGPSGHKRAAIDRGIKAARSDIILTTDADCTTGPEWIPRMMAHFTKETAFVAGPVLYRTGLSSFGDLQALESLGLVAIGAGAIGIGHPNMCNSANVAYRRAAYEAFSEPVGGPVSAGDDEILLQRIARETDWEVAFCSAPEAAVHAVPTLSFGAFLRQRRRWAATGAQYPGLLLRASIGAVYVFFLLLLSSLLALPFSPGLAPYLLLALLLKVVPEGMLLWRSTQHFDRTSLLRYFLPEQLLQIPYVVFVGAAALTGPVYWKGRRIQ